MSKITKCLTVMFLPLLILINLNQVKAITSSSVTTSNSTTSFCYSFYTVKPGDTVSKLSSIYNIPSATIMKYNYMKPNEWLDAGQKITLKGYAPRKYTVRFGEATAPKRYGKLVDWFLEGQYLFNRGGIFTLVDVYTGAKFKVRMLGGYNHSDIEPLTLNDTNIMKKTFSNTWKWTPRPVVIFNGGSNIAASLSGMPHSVETITTNGVTGHFDLYLFNSKPHSPTTSSTYVTQHRNNVIFSSKYR